ncbi:unnamed protein product [Zymoseptoria tritici ST99CH_3D1]|nr:unnamed protein product [Zymoseptoria tritici ST99CH_3D1]
MADGMLSGLLEYAEGGPGEPTTALNPPPRVDHSRTGHPETREKNAVYCGFCTRGQYYIHQSSLDRHMRDCAMENGYIARYWRAAGWKREQLEHGYTWEGDLPRVKPGRICLHCHKVFRNTFEIAKHLNKLNDGGKARALFNRTFQFPGNSVPPAVEKVLPSAQGNMGDGHSAGEEDLTALCGFCNRRIVARTENRMDQHIQKCAVKHKYVAQHWQRAGWLPGTAHGKGMIFEDDVAKVHPDRICSGCKLVFKNAAGMERHQKYTCTDVPEKAEKPRPQQPAQETAVNQERRESPPLAPPSRTQQPAQATASSKRPRESPPSAPPSRPAPPVIDNSALTQEHFIERLEYRINQVPSPEVTELLIRLARTNKDARAIPNAPLLPRRGQFPQSAAERPNKLLKTEPMRPPPPQAQVQVGASRPPAHPSIGAEGSALSRPPLPRPAAPSTSSQVASQQKPSEDRKESVPYQICERCNLKFDPETNNPSRCARHTGVKRVRAQGDPVSWAEYNDPKLQARFYWACCGRSGDSVGCARCAHEPREWKKRKVPS